jgi:hypothetical protein
MKFAIEKEAGKRGCKSHPAMLVLEGRTCGEELTSFI